MTNTSKQPVVGALSALLASSYTLYLKTVSMSMSNPRRKSDCPAGKQAGAMPAQRWIRSAVAVLFATLIACGAAAASVVTPDGVPYKGVNLAGAEFGDALPGIEGTDYAWPTPAEIDYFMSEGMNTFRVAFLWERLQPRANERFDEAYAAALHNIVRYGTSRGATIVLDPHNFARYYGQLVGSPDVPNSVFANLWARLAMKYRNNPKVVFGLMNEPHDMPTEQWVAAANVATAAIRATGATNLISVPGNAWTGAHSWSSDWYGTPNAVAMLDYVDPGNNSIFEIHNYFDADASGAGTECESSTIGSERLENVVDWARQNRKSIWLGEFGTPNTGTCEAAAVNDLLTYVEANADVVRGWIWWAAGPFWASDYQLSIEPLNGADRPQMNWLELYLP